MITQYFFFLPLIPSLCHFICFPGVVVIYVDDHLIEKMKNRAIFAVQICLTIYSQYMRK